MPQWEAIGLGILHARQVTACHDGSGPVENDVEGRGEFAVGVGDERSAQARANTEDRVGIEEVAGLVEDVGNQVLVPVGGDPHVGVTGPPPVATVALEQLTGRAIVRNRVRNGAHRSNLVAAVVVAAIHAAQIAGRLHTRLLAGVER
jgi:hypothetical protein